MLLIDMSAHILILLYKLSEYMEKKKLLHLVRFKEQYHEHVYFVFCFIKFGDCIFNEQHLMFEKYEEL